MASPYVSANSRVGYGREATYGTAVVPSRSFGIFNGDLDPPDVSVEVRQYRNLGSKRKWFHQEPGRRDRSGSLNFLPTVGEFFYYLFGTDSFAAGTPNVHTITTQNGSILPSFTLGVVLEGEDDWMRTYSGCTVDSASFSCNEGGELTCAADIKALDEEDGLDTTPSLFTQPSAASTTPFMFYDVASNISIGGTSFARVSSFNWSVSNNLKTKHFIQSSNAQDPAVHLTSYPDFDLSMEIVPAGFASGDTDAIYHILETETAVDVTVALQQSATNIISVTFDDCIISQAAHTLPEDGSEISVPISFRPENTTVSVSDSIAVYSSL